MKLVTQIAAVRATGALAADGALEAELEAVCQQIGLEAVRIGDEITLTHQAGYGPNQDDPSLVFYELPQTRLVALGVSIALCRDERAGFPTGRAGVEEFDEAVSELVQRRRGGGEAHMSIRHIKAALFDLAEMGYLRVEGEMIRIGSALAGWSESDWASLPTIDKLLSKR
ncbi:MAG: hypothetical protein ACREPW_02880 [Candidatus Binataceae bacterium]